MHPAKISRISNFNYLVMFGISAKIYQNIFQSDRKTVQSYSIRKIWISTNETDLTQKEMLGSVWESYQNARWVDTHNGSKSIMKALCFQKIYVSIKIRQYSI